jgi:hypothetical protein
MPVLVLAEPGIAACISEKESGSARNNGKRADYCTSLPMIELQHLKGGRRQNAVMWDHTNLGAVDSAVD